MNRALAILIVLVIVLACLFCMPMASTIMKLEKFQVVYSETLSSESNYVATASAYKFNGLSQVLDDPYHWTWDEVVLNPDDDCFINDGAVASPTLKAKDGFHWEFRRLKNGNTQFCVNPD